MSESIWFYPFHPRLLQGLRHGLPSLVLLSLLGLSAGCSTNPVTGKSQLNALSRDQEIALGEKSAPEFVKSYGGLVDSQPVRQYVSDLGLQLADVSHRPNLPWEFNVVDSAVVNAFSLPGGKVFITRGLLAIMDNEGELAGVLGHEIAHVTAEHIGQQMAQAIGIQVIGIGLGVAGSVSDSDWMRALGVGSQVGGSLYLLRFSRQDEYQADEIGMQYMTQLGYDPHAMVTLMQKLSAQDKGGRTMEFLSTHPYPEARIERLNKMIAKAAPSGGGEGTLNAEPYHRTVLENLAKLPPPRSKGEPKSQ
jgi:predicted Zn-dependent protease